ncbi:COMM domain [Tritrichomonas musculus]|uniref:COMM domain-containing protein 6 n=1 Tax=Tritrichomonas musculus TaxID=1915356 RepID=A0ABR2H965_9EUKA
MLSQQQFRDNISLFSNAPAEDICQICRAVLDSLQFQTNLNNILSTLQLSEDTPQQLVADTLQSFVLRLLQSRSTDSADQLVSLGLDKDLAAQLGNIISERIDTLAKDLAARSQGDHLSDLEWRFGLTASSNNGPGSAFVQMRLSFESAEAVSVEMGMKEFYEFASDIKKIQTQMANSIGVE